MTPFHLILNHYTTIMLNNQQFVLFFDEKFSYKIFVIYSNIVKFVIQYKMYIFV